MIGFLYVQGSGGQFNGLGVRRLGRSSTKVVLVREPDNRYDSNAVLCYALLEGSRVILGHVSAKAARWLSPLLAGPFSAAG